MMGGHNRSDDKIGGVDNDASYSSMTEKSNSSQSKEAKKNGEPFDCPVAPRSFHASSAARTSLTCPSERELRVPCYCEENVWRLAYRRLYGPDRGGGSGHASAFASRDLPAAADENDTIGARVAGMHAHQQQLERRLEYHVVFMSNEERCCPMFCQVAKDDPDDPCLWDYHVILLCTPTVAGWRGKREVVSGDERSVILDMDSRLPYPCPVKTYLEGTFRNMEYLEEEFREKYAPRFRVINAEVFLRHFYSDRMHMFDEATGQWHATPPVYDCIMSGWDGDSESEITDRRSNLDDYINMTKTWQKCSLVEEDQNKESALGEVLTLEEFRRRFCPIQNDL